jgi:hypothetical protein
MWSRQRDRPTGDESDDRRQNQPYRLARAATHIHGRRRGRGRRLYLYRASDRRPTILAEGGAEEQGREGAAVNFPLRRRLSESEGL